MYQQNPSEPGIEVQEAPTKKAAIIGDRQLTDDDHLLINKAKSLAQEVADLVLEVRDYTAENPLDHDVVTRTNPARWAALADTDFQVGFMKLVRAIARPTTY